MRRWPAISTSTEPRSGAGYAPSPQTRRRGRPSLWGDYVPPTPAPVHLEPLLPVAGIARHECAHRGPISDGDPWVCLCCNHASPANDRIIERMPAATPEDPELRIARLRKMEADNLLTPAEIELARDLARQIEALIDPGHQPTVYIPTPGLKGGLG